MLHEALAAYLGKVEQTIPANPEDAIWPALTNSRHF